MEVIQSNGSSFLEKPCEIWEGRRTFSDLQVFRTSGERLYKKFANLQHF